MSIPAETRALAARLVDKKTGLLRRLLVLPHAPGDFGVRQVVGAAAETKVFGVGAVATPGGRHDDIAGAAVRALGEGVERYCAAAVDPDRLHLGSAADAPAGAPRHLVGDEFPLFAAPQYAAPGFPFRPLTAGSRIHWTRAAALDGGEPACVPAGMVWLPYRPRTPDEILGPCTSTGTACAPSFERAALTALLEVCERDAFVLAWLARRSAPRLVVDPRSQAAARLARLLGRGRARPIFVDLTNDLGVPVVMAVLEGGVSGRRCVTVGASAGPSRALAAAKALLEAIGQATRIRDLAESGPPFVPASGFTNVTEFEHHSLVYADPAEQHRLTFLTAAREERPLPDDDDEAAVPAPALLRRTVAAIAARGERVHAVELTTADVRGLGLRVVKVLVPGAAPLAPDHRYPLLGSPRVRRLGPPEALNPDPHPFA